MNAGEKKNNHKKDRTKTTKKDRTTTAADAAKAHVEDQGDDAKDKAWLLACANISMITCPLVAAFVGVFLNLSNEIECIFYCCRMYLPSIHSFTIQLCILLATTHGRLLF